MISNAAVLCLLLFSAGQLAAASKSFGGGGGGGGYGEEAGGGGKASSSGTPSSTTPAMTPSKSSSSSSTPSTGGDKASGVGASSSTKNKGYGSGTPSSSSSTTPASSGGSSSTPSSTTTPAGAGYGLDPAGEPEYGLSQKAIDDILKEHNAFRAKEHVPPLSWNATLAKFSQQYAEKTLKGPCKMVHSTSPYGENLMLGTGGITWKTTVDQWSDEKRSYHYGSNSCDAGKMCGHYTAVVWKGTTTVGCGRVKCNNGDTMIMCSYWPPGNYDGARPF
ncbi:pathogenesis-related protein PRB1-3 [Setaria viridis]|uniref:pathogenesis-related protein PRB1-3 n=1 Tax=Setaria viridis TaxID=4556 RepID=UPI001493A3A1|nr:pathogenesis-related protein PRB1-3-like [Setaria viridis]